MTGTKPLQVQFRVIATRYDKPKSTFLAVVRFASIIILIN